MIRLAWKSGPSADWEGPLFVSATRFTYRHVWHLPMVSWHALRLRHAWGQTEGAVGVSMSADWFRQTTYSLSVWRSEQDLRQWLRSPYYAALMRAYRARLASTTVTGWHTERFVLAEAWPQAMQRLSFPGNEGGIQDGRTRNS